jgi:hypothetical protein
VNNFILIFEELQKEQKKNVEIKHSKLFLKGFFQRNSIKIENDKKPLKI